MSGTKNPLGGRGKAAEEEWARKQQNEAIENMKKKTADEKAKGEKSPTPAGETKSEGGCSACACGKKKPKKEKKSKKSDKATKPSEPAFKQISDKSEWVIDDYRIAATLDIGFEELEKRLDAKFEAYDVDGLGKARGAFFRTSGGVFFILENLLQAPSPKLYTSIQAKFHPNAGCSARDLREILAATGIAASELSFIQEGINGIK